MKKYLQSNPGDLNPRFFVDSLDFYDNEAPLQLPHFVRWIQKKHPDIPKYVKKRGTLARKLDLKRYISPLFTGLTKEDVSFLEFLTKEEWRTLDELYVQELSDQLRSDIPKLKALLEQIEHDRVRTKSGEAVSFNGIAHRDAVKLGEGDESKVYRIEKSDTLTALKVYDDETLFVWGKQSFQLLEETRIPSIKVIEESKPDRALLLTYAHGLSIQDIQKAERQGFLRRGITAAFEVFFVRHAISVKKEFSPLFNRPYQTHAPFNPHINNWVFDPYHERLILIDPT